MGLDFGFFDGLGPFGCFQFTALHQRIGCSGLGFKANVGKFVHDVLAARRRVAGVVELHDDVLGGACRGETGKVRKREDGKVLKPVGWAPPDLAPFVEI